MKQQLYKKLQRDGVFEGRARLAQFAQLHELVQLANATYAERIDIWQQIRDRVQFVITKENVK